MYALIWLPFSYQVFLVGGQIIIILLENPLSFFFFFFFKGTSDFYFVIILVNLFLDRPNLVLQGMRDLVLRPNPCPLQWKHSLNTGKSAGVKLFDLLFLLLQIKITDPFFLVYHSLSRPWRAKRSLKEGFEVCLTLPSFPNWLSWKKFHPYFLYPFAPVPSYNLMAYI